MNQHDARFSGIRRLFGNAGAERLQSAHVCVIGIGGVGSWSVEALARSGVGTLTLVDLDDICVSNVNRQIHALDATIGKPKIDVMAERARAINPSVALHLKHEFFTESTASDILQTPFNFVLDAIDGPAKKCLLISACRERKIPVFVVGGAGGRKDPQALKITDLAHSTHDRLLQAVRSTLRKEHGFPCAEKKLFGIDCLFSPEPVHYPQSDGTVCTTREEGSTLRLDCDSGYGTAAFVTGAFGLAAAGYIVRKIAEKRADEQVTAESSALD